MKKYEPRNMDLYALNGLAKHLAEEFQKPTSKQSNGTNPMIKWVAGPKYVIESLYNLHFIDEYDWVMAAIRSILPEDSLKVFNEFTRAMHPPRDFTVFEDELATRLAINPAGEHIPGRIGNVELGNRIVGKRVVEVPRYRYKARTLGQRLLFLNGTLMDRILFKKFTSPRLVEMRTRVKNEYWPVYAGELHEREAGNVNSKVRKSKAPGQNGVDPLPEGAVPWQELPVELYATNPRMSNLVAIACVDAIVDDLDKGSTAATIRGRSGTQPATPDFVDGSETGLLLFTLTMPATAFGNASDTTSDATAAESGAITDETSASAGTLGYCRVGATGTGADDTLDGEAGTSASDFNFNTLTIGSGSTVSMSSFDVIMSE